MVQLFFSYAYFVIFITYFTRYIYGHIFARLFKNLSAKKPQKIITFEKSVEKKMRLKIG